MRGYQPDYPSNFDMQQYRKASSGNPLEPYEESFTKSGHIKK